MYTNLIKCTDKIWWLPLLVVVLLSACDIQDNEIEPESVFTKIYNTDNYTDAFTSLSITQTADSGYLILAGREEVDTDFLGIYLIKVDKVGDFVWERSAGEAYANPVSDWIVSGNNYQFFCMDKLNLGTYLLQVNHQDGSTSEISYLGGLQYPLAASSTSDGFVVQGYNREDQKTVLAKLNNNGTTVWQEEYDTFEDVEEDIVRHLIGTTRPLPFFTGQVGSNYYFNGFYNFSFSMLFVNSSDGSFSGVINGPGIDDAISNAISITGSDFAVARYSYLENQLLPRHSIDVNSIGVTGDLDGYTFDEMTQKAQVQIKKVSAAGKSMIVFATDTKGGRILLLAYDQNTQELLGSRYLGFDQPYQMADFTTTKDGGLAVLASTFATGRFARVAMFKLSKMDLETLAGGLTTGS